MKYKKCKQCGELFTPMRPLQSTCTASCAIAYTRSKLEKSREKERKTKLKADRERIKTRGEHLREAQAVFNQYIRLRDRGEPCISCQRHHGGQYHAGHYRSVGACPELRFEELNVHKQCAHCNNYNSGNLINYRVHLIDKIGLEKVEWLEAKHEPQKYTIDDIKAIKQLCKLKIRILKHEQ